MEDPDIIKDLLGILDKKEELTSEQEFGKALLKISKKFKKPNES